ncbi:MAG: hypothetical protein ACRCZW_07705, partial [Lactobacillaceae bacterium]
FFKYGKNILGKANFICIAHFIHYGNSKCFKKNQIHKNGMHRNNSKNREFRYLDGRVKDLSI